MAGHLAAFPCYDKVITLRPLKSIGNLEERYSEATADVVFVGKERLPAHRAILSVASAVFFKMFDGDWKESREKNISAPTEYRWDAFKAAIDLLYGVQVEVYVSSVLDVFRVAHCYDLGNVKGVLAQAISQWGEDMVDTVLKLCALVGELETGEDQREHEVLQAGSSYIVKHLALIKAKPTGVNGLPYEAMLKVVQSEYITFAELELYLLLKQWMESQLDITLRQAQQLYSHIRYGMIPYEFLSHGIIQENLDLTLQNHQQLSVDKLKNNLKLITPRLCQSEVLQVYPLVEGLSVLRQIGKWEFVNVLDPTHYTVGVIFSGRQELSFQLSLNMEEDQNSKLCVALSSFYEKSNTNEPAAQINLMSSFPPVYGKSLFFLDYTVLLKPTGAFLLQMCSCGSNSRLVKDQCSCKSVDLPFRGPFPWILRIAVPCKKSVSMTLHCK